MRTDRVAPLGAAILGMGYALPVGELTQVDPPTNLGFQALPAYLCTGSPGEGVLAPKTLRRLGRSQKLVLTAANLAIQDFGIPIQTCDSVAISVGSGLGALGEMLPFLENMIRLEEREPKPTRFINAVNNSSATQTAMAFGFKGENHTFVHASISFESALWQALTLLRRKRARYALACGVDEVSPYGVALGTQMGCFRTENHPLAPMTELSATKRGTLAGEGAAAFLLGGESPDGSKRVARIAAFRVRPLLGGDVLDVDASKEIEFIERTLAQSGIHLEQVDFVLLGANGDSCLDAVYDRVIEALPHAAGHDVPFGAYKHRCGEYPTASAAGLAFATTMIREGRVPPEIMLIGDSNTLSPVSNVLMYNLSKGGYHSACLVTT